MTHPENQLSAQPGGPTFAALLRGVSGCQRVGAISPGDPEPTATLLWLALHGTATLPIARPAFPWPTLEQLVDDILERIAGLRRSR
jgi:hypothetical protein